jgi:tyrosine-protein kinase Etk/Wzc
MSSENKEIHLLKYVDLLVQHRWMIIRNTVLVAVIAVIVAFLLPKKYTATATLMPPQEQEKMSMTQALSDLSVPGISLPTPASYSEIMTEILKSRSVNVRVLQRRFFSRSDSLPLYRILDFDNKDQALLYMPQITRFIVTNEGIIKISVTLRDAALAADVANAFVEELDRVNQEKSVSRAKNSRLYIESQLRHTDQKLDQATKALAEFQREHKAVSLEEQTKASILQAGELKGEILAKEVQIGVMLQTMKRRNPLVIRAQRQLNELRQQYQQLQNGNGAIVDSNEVIPSLNQVPGLGTELAELMRKVKIQETVWQLLNQQYYQTKIQEARDTPTVQVLDAATAPVIPSSPRKKAIVIVFTLLSFILCIMWAFVLHYRQSLEQRPEEKQRWNKIITALHSDINTFRQKTKNLFSRIKQ